MNRSTVDKLISSTAIVVAVVLFGAAGGLWYAYTFIHSQVHEQLSQQRITFPAPDSKQLNALAPEHKAKVSQYAGQQLVTGRQAKVFADNYIGAHLEKSGGGKTYAELSAAAQADPKNTELAAKVQTLFRGETLRGLLLNAYAFDTMAIVARYASLGALVAGVVLFVLAGLGFRHSAVAKKSPKKRS